MSGPESDSAESLKNTVLDAMKGLTGSEEGMRHLTENAELIVHFYAIAYRGIPGRHCETAHVCLVNMASHTLGIKTLYRFVPTIDEWLVFSLQDLDCPYAELKCKILVNLTRCPIFCTKVVKIFHNYPEFLKRLLYLFNSDEPELKGNYHYLAMVFGNLSCVPEGQSLFLNHERPYVKYLLPFTTYGASAIRRHGIGILLKNLCFFTDAHQWLLEDIDILPALLLPLAGPEPFKEHEMEKLPPELQYLGEDQMRESHKHIRLCLIEALYKLCTTMYGRMYLRNKHVYYVLRNLQLWETEPMIMKAVESVMAILIRDEADINDDDPSTLEVPPDLVEKFQTMNVTSTYYC